MTKKPPKRRTSPAQAPQSRPTREADGDNRTVVLDRDKLLAHRRRLGWSQAMLASRSGLSEDTVSRAENGRRIRLGGANVIASTYDVSLQHLLPHVPDFPSGSDEAEPTADALLAVGPDIVCTGGISEINSTTWTLCLKHFLMGDLHKLISFIDGFDAAVPEHKYVLSNELGDGRVLTHAPRIKKLDGALQLRCPVGPSFPRIDAQALGSEFAQHPETGDLYRDEKGSFARIAGVDALPQRVQCVLSMQRGESPFYPESGTRFFEYYENFRGTRWLAPLMMLDVIRQAAIPLSQPIMNRQSAPLQCVNRVRDLELLSETPKNHRLPVRLTLDVQGIGEWKRDLFVYIPTSEQVAQRAPLLAAHAALWRGWPVIDIGDVNPVPAPPAVARLLRKIT